MSSPNGLRSPSRWAMSAPEQKPLPAPVRTTQRTERSSATSAHNAAISVRMGSLNAFRCSGRFSVTVRTCSARSTRMVSGISGARYLPGGWRVRGPAPTWVVSGPVAPASGGRGRWSSWKPACTSATARSRCSTCRVPELGPGEVLVEVVALRHLRHRPAPRARADRAARAPVLGHEWAGTIAAVGRRGHRLGARRRASCAGPTPGCGECRACRARPAVGVPAAAPPSDHLAFRGAFARYIDAAAVAAARASPTRCRPRDAALTEPTAIALHAVTLSGVTPEDRVLVTGAGPVGMLVTAVLHAQGIHDVTVSEPAPARRERALEVGAAQRDRARRAADAVDGAARWPSPTRSCSSAPAAPRPPSRRSTSSTTRARSCSSAPATSCPRVNHNRAIILESTILGAYNYDAAGWAPALELLASGRDAARRADRAGRRARSTACSP